MSEENVNTEEQPNQAPEGDHGETQTKKKDETQELIAAMRSELSKYREENETLKSKMEEDKKKSLEGSQNYKELWEIAQKEAEQNKQRFTELQEFLVTDKRNSAIREAAIKAGIREEAVQDLDLVDHNVQIETTSTGNINVLGLDGYINNLKAQRPHWFSNQTPPKVNAGGGHVVADKKLNPSQIVEMQKKDPEKYKAYMKKHYNIG